MYFVSTFPRMYPPYLYSLRVEVLSRVPGPVLLDTLDTAELAVPVLEGCLARDVETTEVAQLLLHG